MEHLPGIYLHFEEAFADVHAAHQELARRCYEAGPIDERAARLVKLGIAIGAQADGSVRSHARRALSEGHSADEIRHVAVLALTTIGFPNMIAGLEWIEEVLAKEASPGAA
jgi:alkylhydroperoxidase/carboxymuconolactone decarboxylase family protein YurZ